MPASDAGFEAQLHDYTTRTVSGGRARYGESKLGRANLTLKTTWELGRHTLKAGGEYSSASWDEKSFTNHVIKQFSDDRFRDQVTLGGADLKNRVGGLFAQDSWQVSDRWRINLAVTPARAPRRSADDVQPASPTSGRACASVRARSSG